MVKILDKDKLFRMYITEELNPYQIGEILGCNHKTVRSYLRRYEIPLRTPSEYNFIPRKNFVPPSQELLSSSLSVAGHTAYLCEGYHTDKAGGVQFCNQDPELVDLFVTLLTTVYHIKRYRIGIYAAAKKDATYFLDLYPTARFYLDKSRKNPILKVHCGGKSLVRDLVQNCYVILRSLPR